MKNQTPPVEMTDEQILEMREYIDYQIEQMEAHRKVIDEELVLRAEKNDGIVTPDYTVTVTTTYTTDKDTARELGAIAVSQMERIDTKMIREMHLKGIEIKNLVVNKRPNVRPIKKGEDE